MKFGISKFGLSALALVAALFVSAPAANAQSIDFRVGGGHHNGWHNGGWDHRGGHHGGGFSIDIRIGDPRCGRGYDCYPRGPVYREPYPPVYRGPVYRGPVYRDDCGRCDDDYNYRPSSIQVLVTEYTPVYDRYGRYCGDRRWEHYVTAYWRGDGYYWTDNNGYTHRAR